MDLVDLFRGLARPSIELGPSTFQVAPIPQFPTHRLGKDGVGAPVLLLSARTDSSRVGPPIALQHVSVQHRVRCRLLTATSEVEEDFTVVRCLAAERELRDYFTRVCEAALHQLGPDPAQADVTNAVRRLTELFRSFETPARKTVQGLWAELVIIAFASNPLTLIQAWHIDPDEGFDFAQGAIRLEVKSFTQSARVHNFSLRQARPGSGVTVVIASLRAERSGGGATIEDLIAAIASRSVGPDAVLKVRDIVARSLGSTAGAALTLAFDLERARDSLRFFAAESVPSVDPTLPPGVLSVRFEALLDEARALSTEGLASAGQLVAAAGPYG